MSEELGKLDPKWLLLRVTIPLACAAAGALLGMGLVNAPGEPPAWLLIAGVGGGALGGAELGHRLYAKLARRRKAPRAG
jgi:hypothetical protein